MLGNNINELIEFVKSCNWYNPYWYGVCRLAEEEKNKLIEKANRVDELEEIIVYHDSLINDKSFDSLTTEFTIDELARIIIRERKRKNELYKSVDELEKENRCLGRDIKNTKSERDKIIKQLEDTNKHLEKENEQLKQDALLGKALDWYHTECKNEYIISGGRISRKRKYEILKERILRDYQQQLEKE